MNNDNQLIITCFLFSKCNLKCNHCFYNKNVNDVDVDKISKLPKLIFDTVQSNKRIKTFNTVSVVVCGGEVFIDSFKQSMFDLYKRVVNETKQLLCDYNVEFEFISNAIFNNVQRVEQLLVETNSKISISYDPVGRYSTEKQKQTAIDNIQYFDSKRLLSCIESVATNQAIEYWLSNVDQLRALNRYRINVAWYIPNHNIETKNNLLPTEEQVYQYVTTVLKHRLYNFTEITAIVGSILSDPTKHSTYCDDCFCPSVDLQSGLQCGHNCSLLKITTNDYDTKTKAKIAATSAEQLLQYRRFQRSIRKCGECRYNRICLKKCWLSDDGFLDMNTVDQCWIYRVYQFLAKNKDIIKDYSEYLKSM